MANRTNGLRYKEGDVYLLSSVIRKNALYFGGDGNYFTIVTNPTSGVSYRVTFRENGEVPYGGKAVKCVLVQEQT